MEERIDCPYCGDIAYRQELIWSVKLERWFWLYVCVVCMVPCMKEADPEDVPDE